MEDPLSFAKNDEADFDHLKNSGSEAEDDIRYHSIGRNIKVFIFSNFSWVVSLTADLIGRNSHGFKWHRKSNAIFTVFIWIGQLKVP